MDAKNVCVPAKTIEEAIFLIRGQKVMIDADLAILYGVQTKALNQAVKRNTRRFPPDFMFCLTKTEKNELVTNCDRLQRLKHSSGLPRAFTEQGVAMLSSVLKSAEADTIIPVRHAEALAAALPTAKLIIIDGGHNDWSFGCRVKIRNP